MSDRSPIRLGVAGIGGMGGQHARAVASGGVPGAVLAAVCDRNREHFAAFPGCEGFTDADEMFSSGAVDAVIISTPHYSHTPLSVAAMKASLHVLVDKPLGVHKADCEISIAAHEDGDPSLVFGVMFNQRTVPAYRALKDLIDGGELGAVRRFDWTITDWFRPEAYYRAADWRGTWAGEGGGVLLNQCPHQLDLIQWLFGMPSRIRAFGSFGRYHGIETEDDVTAYLEYEGGLHGLLTASTGESPGTNRLEIACEAGRIVVENERIEWLENDVPVSRFSTETSDSFGRPGYRTRPVPLEDDGIPQHARVIRAFVDAIRGTGSLVASGREGIRSVELANAAISSIVGDAWAELPLDSGAYAELLESLVAEGRSR